jgi:phage terminase small subunit
VKRSHNKSGEPMLTPMEQKFILAYTTGTARSALQAAVKAGYKHPQKEAHFLMQRPLVAAEIARRQKMLQESADFGLRELLEESVYAATFDISGIFRPGTFQVLPVSRWRDQRLREVVEKITVTKGKNGSIRTEVRFVSRSASLDRIAKMLGVSKATVPKAGEGNSIPASVIAMITGCDSG